jgi:hypothetical protein
VGRSVFHGAHDRPSEARILKEEKVKRLIVATTGVASLLVGVGVSAGTSAASSSSHTSSSSHASSSSQRVITLTGHQRSLHIVDNAPKGDSAGDFGILAGKLSQHGRHVGGYQGYCVQIDSRGHSQCTFTYALPKGQIVIVTGYGSGVNGNKTTHEPVVGGTGSYATARGYATGQETSRTTIKEVVHLLN